MPRRRPITAYAGDFFPPAFAGAKRFTEQSLRYGTPYAKARRMVEHLTALMPGRWRVVEVFAGIGCNTLAFMEARHVAVTDVIEADALTARRLASNTAAWAGTLKRPPPAVHQTRPTVLDVVTLARGGSGSPPGGSGSPPGGSGSPPGGSPTLVFLDPPWGDERPYSDPMQYVLAPNGDTVETCVHALMGLPDVAVVAVKVPKDVFAPAPLPPGVACSRFTELKKMDLLCFTKCPLQ